MIPSPPWRNIWQVLRKNSWLERESDVVSNCRSTFPNKTSQRKSDITFCSRLRTKDEVKALTILHYKNEAHRQPILNLQITRMYLKATDPEVAKRTWQVPMDEMTKTRTGPTRARHEVANLKGEDVDWTRTPRSFTRQKNPACRCSSTWAQRL